MPQEVVHISARNPLIKIISILLLLAAGVWSYFSVRWYIGNTLAEYFNPAENNMEVALMAVSMAPDDPLTHWRVAQVSKKVLPLDQQAQAIAEYEKAVSLSPNDYRFWMSLGTAYEQAGETAKAEQALKQAVALAPSYSYPRWFLGNLFLRNGRYDEAFAQLRLASEADPLLQPQQFNLIWEIYKDDPEALKNAAGESPDVKAAFSLYLLSQQRFEEGMRLWNDLNREEKRSNKETAEKIIKTLKDHLSFHSAARVWNDIMPEDYRSEVGRVFDGGFEAAVAYDTDIVFGWQVTNAPQMHVAIDPAKGHTGGRSLRLVFQVRTNFDGPAVSQLVPVLPGTEYDLEFYLSTDKLETGAAPEVQIFDANTGTPLVTSGMAPSGTNDWNRISLSFKTGEKTEGIILKVARVSCATQDTPVCPIFGSVWYDDFSLKRRK